MGTCYTGNNEGASRLANWEREYKPTQYFKRSGHACISHLRGYNCAWHYNDRKSWRTAEPQRWPNFSISRLTKDMSCYDPRPCRLPFADHSSLWKDKRTGELVYITQPYTQSNNETGFDKDDIDITAAFCKQYGLKMEIDSSVGWHNPPACTCVIVKRDTDAGVLFGGK